MPHQQPLISADFKKYLCWNKCPKTVLNAINRQNQYTYWEFLFYVVYHIKNKALKTYCIYHIKENFRFLLGHICFLFFFRFKFLCIFIIKFFLKQIQFRNQCPDITDGAKVYFDFFFTVAPCEDGPMGTSISSIKMSIIAGKFSILDFCVSPRYALAFKCTSKKLMVV